MSFAVAAGSACSSNPCHGGATCEDHDGTFTCFCTSDRTGDTCDRQLDHTDVHVAAFDGAAFVELKSMADLGVEHKFSLDVEFRADAPNGVIAYAHQRPDAEGDFVSLALVDG